MRAEHTISQARVRLSADSPVRAEEMAVRAPVGPHDHDYCEVCFVTHGRGLHLTREGRRPMKRGDILVTAPGEVHSIRPLGSLRVINLYYLSEWLLRDLGDFTDQGPAFSLFFAHALFRVPQTFSVPHFSTSKDLGLACERELRDLVREGNRARPSAVFLRAAFTKFMIQASSAYMGGPRDIRRAFRREVWQAVERIERLLAAEESYDAAELARGLPFSAGHLTRIFRRQTGWTPSDYYQYRRIQRSCQALLDRRLSITEVALAAGFADASHFDRRFRRFFGLTPRAYRKLYT